MGTMRAVRAHIRGGAEQLHLERAPVPVAQDDEVLVAVYAAAITYDELLWDESWTRDGRDRTPIVPSHEMSGVVVGRGDAVTDLPIGTEVYGLVDFDRDGAAAEFVAVRAGNCAPRPRTVDHIHAAALPLATLTAWQALFDHARVIAGETVLVLGGAGGVGAYVVQLAHHVGAEVTATVRDLATADYVEALGAHTVVEVLPDGAFDVVVDTVGGPTLAAAYAHVRPGGRLVTLGAPPGPELKQGRDVDDTFFIVRPDRPALERIASLVDTGALRALVGETFPLADTATAYADRGRRGGPGKTVIVVR